MRCDLHGVRGYDEPALDLEAELLQAWLCWDDQAQMLRDRHWSKDSWKWHVECEAEAARMDAACRSLAEQHGLNGIELRALLSSFRRDGFSREASLAKALGA